MNEIQLDTCTKNILCVDCKDTTCLHAGKIMADCPKYKCDNDVLLDCKHCKFLKQLTKTIRRNAKYETALSKHIEDALKKYNADNIDIAKDEMTGNIGIIYHSDNNSFAIVPNICKADDIDIDIIKKLSEKYDIGYCL